MHVCTLPKTKRKEYHLQTYASWTGVSLLDDQLEGGKRKVGFNTDANHNLKLHTRKQDHVEKGEAIGLGMHQMSKKKSTCTSKKAGRSAGPYGGEYLDELLG